MGIQQLEQHDLPPDNVLIQIAYAAVNYKDVLACLHDVTVARAYPRVFALGSTGAADGFNK